MLPLRGAGGEYADTWRAQIGLQAPVARRSDAAERADAMLGVVRVVGTHGDRAPAVADRASGGGRIGILLAEMRLAARAADLALDPGVVVTVDHVRAGER